MPHNDTPLSHKLLLAFIASMMGISVVAAPDERPGQPKLVVGIMVDNLQEEYINLLRQYFGDGGINRILNDGVLLSNVDYGTSLDPTAATAVIYTGAAPSVNGIPADEVFDRPTLRPVPIFNDAETMGNYTVQTLSPRALQTSTIADEMRIAGGGYTYAFAITPDASQALIMAGHAGNYGTWINDANDCWATTTYYREDPMALNMRNRNKPLVQKLDTLAWTPLMPDSKYSLLPYHLRNHPFKYTFRQKDADRIKSFKNSPAVNTEVTDFAIDHIRQYDLGNHDGPDMISLSYTLQPFDYSSKPDNRYELIDAYYRLDNDIARLLGTIDQKVGLHNTLVFIASAPTATRSRRDDEKWRIPYGEFSTRKAISLLNLYLIALHGNGNWVEGFHNGEFFLNHKLIKEQSKDLDEIRQQSAAFLIQMAGVSDCYAITDVINNRRGLMSEPLRRNISLEHSGDIRIAVMPGWELVDDYNYPGRRTNNVTRDEATTSPLMIMAPGLSQKVINTRVDARSIAPTVTRLLRIRSPNAASLPPLVL